MKKGICGENGRISDGDGRKFYGAFFKVAKDF